MSAEGTRSMDGETSDIKVAAIGSASRQGLPSWNDRRVASTFLLRDEDGSSTHTKVPRVSVFACRKG
jgi:hypothetical protein